MDHRRWDLASQVRTALEAVGMRLADDGDAPGVRVVPVAAGVRVQWVPGELSAASGLPEPDLRAAVQSSVTALLDRLGHPVSAVPAGTDVLVLLPRPNLRHG